MRSRFVNPVQMLIGFSLISSALLAACGKTTNTTPSSSPAPAAAPGVVNNVNGGVGSGALNDNHYNPTPNFDRGPSRPGGSRADLNPGRGNTPDWAGAPASDDDNFNAREVLGDDQGRWVTIGGIEYFRPHTADREYVPFRHGNWGYDNDRGWTWVSQEPFARYTDHTGAWRHHPVYKWVWQPPTDHHYRPASVTFFDHDDQIGWVPFVSDQPELYAQGREAGFDDGFWEGPEVFAQVRTPGFSFELGVTLVNRVDIGADDIFEHVILEPVIVTNVVFIAQRSARFSIYPGGNREKAYGFFAPYFRGGIIPTGRSRMVDLGHGHHYLAPVGFTRPQLPPRAEAPPRGSGFGPGPFHPSIPAQPGFTPPHPRPVTPGTPMHPAAPNLPAAPNIPAAPKAPPSNPTAQIGNEPVDTRASGGKPVPPSTPITRDGDDADTGRRSTVRAGRFGFHHVQN